MSFEHSAESSLSFPYNLFVEPGSRLEFETLFQEDSEDWDSLWDSEPTDEALDRLEREEYIKSLFRYGES